MPPLTLSILVMGHYACYKQIVGLKNHRQISAKHTTGHLEKPTARPNRSVARRPTIG